MAPGTIVMVNLSAEQTNALNGNKLSQMPAVVTAVWDNEYAQHPVSPVGINVRVFTDSVDNPLWLTSLPLNFDGAKEMFGDGCATYQLME